MAAPRLRTLLHKQARRMQRKAKRLLQPSPKKATHAEKQSARANWRLPSAGRA